MRHQDTWTMNSQVKVIEMYKTKKRKNTLLRYSVGVATKVSSPTERHYVTQQKGNERQTLEMTHDIESETICGRLKKVVN